MAKKNTSTRKARGIATIEASDDLDASSENGEYATAQAEAAPAKKQRKVKAEPVSGESYSVADVRKAASFVKSVGSLDKAVAVLQILKVAREV